MAGDNYTSVLTSQTPNLFCLLYSQFPRPSARNCAYQYPGGLLTDCHSVQFVLLFGVDTLAHNDGRRLLTCASHVGSTSIKSPKGGVINVALTDPTDLSVDYKSSYLWSQKHNSWVVSTLLGQTMYYSNSTECYGLFALGHISH